MGSTPAATVERTRYGETDGERAIRVHVIGAGRLGRGLARALRGVGVRVASTPFRRADKLRRVDADVVVLAVRESELGPLAAALATRGLEPRSVVLHCSGLLGPEVLEPARAVCAGVAQMHPMISFASQRFVPPLAGGHVQIEGDPEAVRWARRLARRLGMIPRGRTVVERTLYHAAAALVANGSAALAAAAVELLGRAGVPRAVAPKMLGPLLASVAANVEALGLPAALTGPVSRGDALAVQRHSDALAAHAPEVLRLFRELVLAQVAVARGQAGGSVQVSASASVQAGASVRGLDAIERWAAESERVAPPLRGQ